MKKTLTVVIPARNEENTIAKTLRSLMGWGRHRPTRLPDRVIVVDDGSTDRTNDIASSFSNVEVLKIEHSTGKKSKAQNAALELVETDLVMTVDADTELEFDAVEKLVAPHEKLDPPAVTCAYVVTKNPKGLLQRGRSITYYYGHSYFKNIQSKYNMIMVASGCASVYNTEIIRSVGGFQSETVTEDMDITLRVITGGKRLKKTGRNRVILISNAYAYTTDPNTFIKYRGQMRRWHGGFFHNLWIHRKDLYKFPNIGLSSMFCFYIADLILGLWPVFYYPLQAWLGLDFGMFSRVILWIWGAELAAASLFALYKGGVKLGKPLETLISLPCYPITRVIDQIYFIEAFWRVIIRRKPPIVWEKGH